MAQFDIYRNNDPRTRESIPYLLDVQADILASLSTRVVAPLIAAASFGKPVQNLNPRFRVGETDVVMSTAEIAGIGLSLLGEKVDSLAYRRGEILAALDFLLTGF